MKRIIFAIIIAAGTTHTVAGEEAHRISTLQHWWDDDMDAAVSSSYTPEQFTLDTDGLCYGLHALHYRVKDNSGRWSATKSSFFYKGRPTVDAGIASYAYWWNDMEDRAVIVAVDGAPSTIMINQDITIPEEARDGFADHCAALFTVVVTDTRGRKARVSSVVTYPDTEAPTTVIQSEKYIATSTVKLTWSETTGDLMGDYNVYVSKDRGPFILWLPDTTSQEASFRGESGSVYVFTVTGRDAAGNREDFDESKCVSVIFE